MNISLAQSTSIKNKRSLRITSSVVFIQLFLPIAFMSIFLKPELLWQFAVFDIIYGTPFIAAGFFGLLISTTNDITSMKLLVYTYICFFGYCVLGALIFLALCILFIIEKIVSTDNIKEFQDSVGLGGENEYLFLIFFVLGTIYFIFGIFIGWRGVKISITLRDLLILGEPLDGNQQSMNFINFNDNPPNRQPQLDPEYPYFIDSPSNR